MPPPPPPPRPRGTATRSIHEYQPAEAQQPEQITCCAPNHDGGPPRRLARRLCAAAGASASLPRREIRPITSSTTGGGVGGCSALAVTILTFGNLRALLPFYQLIRRIGITTPSGSSSLTRPPRGVVTVPGAGPAAGNVPSFERAAGHLACFAR